MNHTETIVSQVNLLAELNRQLAGQATPEAAKEIRENIRLITELASKEHEQRQLADMAGRLAVIEEVLFQGDEPDPEALPAPHGYHYSLVQYARDTRDDLDDVYRWMERLENHLELDEGWDDNAGE